LITEYQVPQAVRDIRRQCCSSHGSGLPRRKIKLIAHRQATQPLPVSFSDRLIPAPKSLHLLAGGPIVRLALCLMILMSLAGCGVVAFPFRVTGDAVEAVPVVGKPLGKPIHGIGDAID
jgi:hypothetical protein